MTTPRVFLALLLGVSVASWAPAAAPPPGPTSSQIARWVEQLGDDNFSVREGATKKLREAGEVAETALQAALKNRDVEISRRAKSILEQYRWGIYPDTPEKIVELIRSYQSAARSEKRDLIRKLLVAGPHGCRAMVKIARYENDPQVRKEVFADIGATLGKVAPQLIEQGNRDALEGLLEVALSGDVRSGAPNYAAYYLLTNQLSDKIRDWELRARKSVVAKTENEVLAYLYRAGGDRARARKAAAEAERNDLLEAFLYEAADWKALAGKPELIDGDDSPRKLGYQAAYARLAGDKKAADEVLADIKKRAEPLASMGGFVLPYAKALFINGMGIEGADLLSRGNMPLRWTYDVLVAQNRFAKAFALVDLARKSNHEEKPTLEILQARTLYQLGEKDKALATFKTYADAVKGGLGEEWVVDLVEAELAIGRRDNAFAVAVKILGVSADNRWPQKLFAKLYSRRRAEDALRLRLLLRRVYKDEKDPQIMARLRPLFEGKATAKQIDALFSDAAGALKGPAKVDVAEEWRILGDIALAHKQIVKASKAFRQAGTPRAAIRLGDLLFEQQQWQKAADAYLAAYRLALKAATPEARESSDDGESLPALALALSGQALLKAGQTKAARERMDRAHLLPLGDAEMRYDLSQALLRRDHAALARREQQLLRLIGEPVLTEQNSYYTGEGLRAAALEAIQRKDWVAAADGFEQSFLRILHPGMSFQRTAAYVAVPSYIFYLRARGLVQAGKLDEAKVEIARASDCVPGNIEMAMHLVPQLDRKNRKGDADALFAASLAPYREILKSYPRSTWALNQSAWLSATCRRQLKQGLRDAREAVKLEPSSAAYLDTLAEVLFQLGKKDEAVAAQKKAIALAPKRDYFKQQLKRIEAGDPKAERPSEE